MLLLAISMRTSKLTLLGNITDVDDISIDNSGVVFVMFVAYSTTMPMQWVECNPRGCWHH